MNSHLCSDNKSNQESLNLPIKINNEKIKLILVKSLLKQKKFLDFVKNELIEIIQNNEIANEKAKKIYSLLSYLISELSITFTEIIKEDACLMSLLFIIIKKQPDLFEIRNIFVNIIKVYNYETSKSDIIRQIKDKTNICDIFNGEKRVNTNQIENLIDRIYIIKNYINSAKKNCELNLLDSLVTDFTTNIKIVKDIISHTDLEYVEEQYNIIKNLLLEKKAEFLLYKEKNVEKELIIKGNNDENGIVNINPINSKDTTENTSENIIDKSNESINHNETSNEISEPCAIPLVKRTFFYYGESLNEGESQNIEYKNFVYPFNEFHKKDIIKQYLGFLNSKGGRIYIGVEDTKKVFGLNLKYKERDTLRSDLIALANDIYPSVRVEKIKIDFIPIKNHISGKYKRDLYVIKIVVLPGEPFLLYSSYSKNNGILSYLRNQSQVFSLNISELYTEINKRYEIRKAINRYSLNDNNSLFDDPEPDIAMNFDSDNDEVDNKSKEDNNNDEKIKKRYIYHLKITNIDKNLRIKAINRLFTGCGSYKQVFKGEDGKNNGEGYLAFKNEITAKKVMERFNGSTLGGDCEVKMFIETIECFTSLNK